MPTSKFQGTAIDHRESRIRQPLLSSFSFLADAIGSVYFWWCLGLVWAGVLALASRHGMNPDGLDYLEMASGALSGGPSKLVSGYWSPGYPALISMAMLIFRPSPRQEFPLIHCVNFFIFAPALLAFTFFFRAWLSDTHRTESLTEDEKRYAIPFAFGTFLWFTLQYIGVGLVTPDLCVAAIIFFAAGISYRLSLPGSTWKHYVALGLVLAAGYYAKAAMFPLGLALLGVLFLWRPSHYLNRPKLLLSLIIFLLMAAPLIALVSRRVGRLSFGEVGRIAYLVYVNRVGDDILNDGGLDHPPRKLIDKPLTYEFAYPIDGTYPLTYDPSYWYAGAKARFDLRQQILALKETLLVYKDILERIAAFIAGAIVLCGLILREKRVPTIPRNSWWQLAWFFAACAMYGLVYAEARYLAGFLVLFWLAIYGALMFRVNKSFAVLVVAALILTVMIPGMVELVALSPSTLRGLVHAKPPDYEAVAARLRELGLQSGDRLAVVGYSNDLYYAHLAKLRVVAQIPNADEFWRLSTPELNKVSQRLAAIGVKAIMARNRPVSCAFANWQDLNVSSSTRSSILLLADAAQPNTH